MNLKRSVCGILATIPLCFAGSFASAKSGGMQVSYSYTQPWNGGESPMTQVWNVIFDDARVGVAGVQHGQKQPTAFVSKRGGTACRSWRFKFGTGTSSNQMCVTVVPEGGSQFHLNVSETITSPFYKKETAAFLLDINQCSGQMESAGMSDRGYGFYAGYGIGALNCIPYH